MKPSKSYLRFQASRGITIVAVRFLSLLNRKHFAVSQNKPHPNFIKTLVYATYTRNGKLREDEMLFLRQAKDNGWLVIVGNNGRLINPAKPEIADFYFERPNKNRDLGVYAEAVRRYPQFQSEIIFTNSSLRWSKNSLKNIYAEIEKRNEFEVLFMTESLQPIRHGQTFFIWFSKESVLSGTHKKIMNPRRNWGSKRLLVWSEELTMLQRIEKLNNTVGFLLRYSQLTRQFKSEDKVKDLYDLSDFKSISERVEKNIPLNPSIHFSPLVFQRFGIHKSSLFANPAQMKSPLHFLQSGKNS